jgi:AcrR family transcriptional regulator
MPEPRNNPDSISRLERRKANTRQKLVDAARAMLADGRAPTATVQEITDAADVGFGSFYNHFAGKAELFEAAVEGVLEDTGALLDRLNRGVTDPALAFARSIRLAARLARSHPDIAQVLVHHGLAFIDSDRGLAPRAELDIRNGIASGRFHAANARLALGAVAGSLLATLYLSLSDPDLIDDAACDQLAEQLLRMLGVAPDDARELASLPLPELDRELSS